MTTSPLSGIPKNQRGATVVEYVVITVFIAVAVIAVVIVLQTKGEVIFTETGTTIGEFGKIQ